MLDSMKAGDLLGLHEYWIDGADLSNPWHVGRWQLAPEIENVPKVITECGRDRVEGQGNSGWKGHCSAETMIDELRDYNSLLDDTVLGATVFTIGRVGEWRDFDATDLVPFIIREYAGQQLPDFALEHPIPGARISQRFGANPDYYAKHGLDGHNGLDFAADGWTRHGEVVTAAHSGYAVAGYSAGYGLYVYLWGDGLDTLYAHLAEVTLPTDRQIQDGDRVGRLGYSGTTIPRGIHGAHLHFGIRTKPYDFENGFRGYVDPQPFIEVG